MQLRFPKPLHGWRAFVGEVGIIVLGVLIALACGQLVDSWQWRNKIRHAEAAMRLELAEDNGPQAYGRLLIGRCLNEQIARIRDGTGKATPEQLRQWVAAYAPPFQTWDSEAWKALVASDIGSHLGSDRLIAWSSPYRMLPALSDHNEREAQLVMQLRDILPPSGEPSPSDLQSLRQTAGQLGQLNRRFMVASQLLLRRIGMLGAQVPEPIQRGLTLDAGKIYGNCVTVPDVNAKPVLQGLRANLRNASLSQ